MGSILLASLFSLCCTKVWLHINAKAYFFPRIRQARPFFVRNNSNMLQFVFLFQITIELHVSVCVPISDYHCITCFSLCSYFRLPLYYMFRFVFLFQITIVLHVPVCVPNSDNHCITCSSLCSYFRQPLHYMFQFVFLFQITIKLWFQMVDQQRTMLFFFNYSILAC